MLSCSAILALVTFSGLQHAWPIFLLTSIASAAWAFDTPARQSLMPTLVPIKDFPNAASLSILVFQIGLISGPPLAGFLLATRGPGLVYGINFFFSSGRRHTISLRDWSSDVCSSDLRRRQRATAATSLVVNTALTRRSCTLPPAPV